MYQKYELVLIYTSKGFPQSKRFLYLDKDRSFIYIDE